MIPARSIQEALRSRVSTITLLLALFAGCGGGEKKVSEHAFTVASGFNPIKECSTTSFGRFVRGASCPMAELLFISREPAPQVMLASMRAELTLLGMHPEERSLRINGRDQEALSVLYGTEEQPIVSSLATVLAIPGSSDSIEVQCYATDKRIDPKRCSSLLDSFIEQGLLRGEWPSVLNQAPARRSIEFNVAGHAVMLPGSCDELGLFDVDCPEGHVQMHILETPDQLQTSLGALLTHSKDETLALERELDCVVEGLPTRCSVRRFRLPYGDALHVYHAALTIRSVPTLLSCTTKQSRSGDLLPGALCSRFFAFDEGVLVEPPEPD